MKIKTITIDLWGTLLFDGPASDNRYKKRRLADFEPLLAAAGMPVSAAALDRAYDESGSYLSRIWATHRDVPVDDHVRAILAAVDPGLPRRVPPALMTALIDAYTRPILMVPPAVDDGALAVLLDEPLRRDRFALHGFAPVSSQSRPCTLGRSISTFSDSRKNVNFSASARLHSSVSSAGFPVQTSLSSAR